MQLVNMCLNPISIRNPAYRGTTYYRVGNTGVVEKPSFLISQKEYIDVNCGKCSECRNSYYNSIYQRAYCESLNSYMYFVTLTYDNNHLPSLKLPNGDIVFYFEYKHIQDCFKRIRNNNLFGRDFRYICVNEYGDKHSRPHAHLIIFLAKYSTDDVYTPFLLEKIVFNALFTNWSINVGTRKNPIYEPLFTYRTRFKNGKLFSNFFVKYVEPQVVDKPSPDSDTFGKTINYLISYINKGSGFDKQLLDYLTTIEDKVLLRKLKCILSVRVRFSRGFGCGFVDGEKVYYPRSFVSVSSNNLYYNDVLSTFPDLFSDFVDLYPDLFDELNSFISSCPYRCYTSIDDFVNSLDTQSYLLHCLLIKYFPDYVSTLFDRYFHYSNTGTITYLFQFLHRNYSYKRPKLVVEDFSNSSLSDFVRKGVINGINNKLPFLSFENRYNNTYQPLCKYYRERFTNLEDVQQLYSSLNIQNIDELNNSFIRYIDNNRKGSIAISNESKLFNDDKICKTQKFVSSLSCRSFFDVFE